MFSTPNKAIIAVIGSFGMVVSSTAVYAQARVVASSGGATDSYPEGKTLRKDAILLLGRGDKVTILVDNVRRTFPGPGKYPINRAIQERSSVSILDSILNFITGDSAVASGAARGRSSGSSMANVRRERGAARARTGAVRTTEPPPSPAPPPPPSPGLASALPAPYPADIALPEVAYDAPMPQAMPDGGGSTETTTYAYAVPAPAIRGRQFNDIDIAKSENICILPQASLQLWRASADSPETVKIVRQSDSREIELTFDMYEQSKSWPEPFDAAPAGDYAIVNVADDTASLISIIPAGTAAEDIGELAVAYSRNECTGQLAALETGLNADGLESTVATVFGAGTR